MNASNQNPCELIAIEPYPDKALREGLPGLSKLIQMKVESIDLDEIMDCDLLFIDSSHLVKTGGDVNYEILEIVPRLKPGGAGSLG